MCIARRMKTGRSSSRSRYARRARRPQNPAGRDRKENSPGFPRIPAQSLSDGSGGFRSVFQACRKRTISDTAFFIISEQDIMSAGIHSCSPGFPRPAIVLFSWCHIPVAV